ncbi:MAG: acylphosphatase [Candidatus Paceibacterota bacterium]
MSKAHLLISGRVQGVTFRASTKKKAQSLGLKGWVRNTEDGKVETVVEGEQEKIEKLIDWCKQGPSLAKVQNIEVDWKEEQEGFSNFEVRY